MEGGGGGGGAQSAQPQKTKKKKKNRLDRVQALFPCEMVICDLGGPATSGL